MQVVPSFNYRRRGRAGRPDHLPHLHLAGSSSLPPLLGLTVLEVPSSKPNPHHYQYRHRASYLFCAVLWQLALPSP